MTELPQVFVTRRLPGRALDALAGVCEFEVWEGEGPPDHDTLRRRTANAEGLLCLLTDTVDAPLMDACPRLRVISNMAVGVDNIDLVAAAARGIAVGNTPGVLTDATADLTMALILAAARHLPAGIAAVRDGSWGPWKPDWLLGLELRDAVLGIIGLGRIGQAVAHRAQAFGMEIIHAGGGIAPQLRALLGRADVVSLHCPLTSETRGLIDAKAIAQMKHRAILINTARGPIVDQHALAGALHRGHLAAAAIDVTDPEPLPPTDPLLQAPNLIVLPHLGSATTWTREQMAELAVANLRAGLAGEPLPNPVTAPNSLTADAEEMTHA
jgi:glyoxylate reductase